MFQVPSSNEGLICHSHLFTDNQWQEAVFEKFVKSGDKKLISIERFQKCHVKRLIVNY